MFTEEFLLLNYRGVFFGNYAEKSTTKEGKKNVANVVMIL